MFTLDRKEGIRAFWFPRSVSDPARYRQCSHFSHRDVEDSFRCAYWCCFRIFIERRADDAILVG